MPSKKTIAFTAAASHTTTIRVVAEMPRGVTLAYDTLPGNQPEEFHNFVGVWDNKVVGYRRPPLMKEPIPSNTPTGTIDIKHLHMETKPYIFGYAVGRELDDVCASAYIAPGQPQVTFSPSLVLVQLTSDLIVVRYSLPAGFDPALARSSVVMWHGQVPRYDAPPIAKTDINSPSNSGIVTITTEILYDSTYTVAVAMTPAQTSLAVSLTFSTALS